MATIAEFIEKLEKCHEQLTKDVALESRITPDQVAEYLRSLSFASREVRDYLTSNPLSSARLSALQTAWQNVHRHLDNLVLHRQSPRLIQRLFDQFTSYILTQAEVSHVRVNRMQTLLFDASSAMPDVRPADFSLTS